MIIESIYMVVNFGDRAMFQIISDDPSTKFNVAQNIVLIFTAKNFRFIVNIA